MQRLIQLLQANGLDWNEEQVSSLAQTHNKDVTNLTDEDITYLVDKAITQSALVKSKSGKPRKRKKPQRTFDNALAKLAKTTGQELDSMVGEVERGAGAAAASAGERMYDAIASIPQESVNHFARLADSHEGDVEGFRQLGREIAEAIPGFSSSYISE